MVDPCIDLLYLRVDEAPAKHNVVPDQVSDTELVLQVVVGLERLSSQDKARARCVESVEKAIRMTYIERQRPSQHRLQVLRQMTGAPDISRVHFPARRLE